MLQHSIRLHRIARILVSHVPDQSGQLADAIELILKNPILDDADAHRRQDHSILMSLNTCINQELGVKQKGGGSVAK